MRRHFSLTALLWIVAALFAAAANAQLTTSSLLASADRATLSASGKVDERVLDALEQHPEVQVLVTFEETAMAQDTERGDKTHQSAIASQCDAVLAPLAPSEFTMTRRFATLPGFAGRVSATGLARFVADPKVLFVALDGGGTGSLSEALPLTNTDDAKNLGVGYSGNGVRVAIIDSGIDSDHPDLADSLVEERCWCSASCCPNNGSIQTGPGSAEDDHGHGSHVAGIIASNGVVAAEGAGPDVEIVALKVLDNTLGFSTDSDVIAALAWLDQQGSPGSPYVDVVNLSLETAMKFGDPCDTEPSASLWANAINNLRSDGTLVVSAAGNLGLGGNEGAGQFLPAPACVSTSLTVAASYDASLGNVFWPGTTTGCTDNAVAADDFICASNANSNTDLVAPGFALTSSWNDGGTQVRGGTSQAAPAVTGCAALLVEADPAVTLADLETFLETSPTTVTSTTSSGLTYPRLDCEAALVALPEPGSSAALAALALSLGAVALRSRP